MEKVLSNGDFDDISISFYKLCKKKFQSNYIKKLLSNKESQPKFNRNVLNNGIIGALESNQEEYIHIIFKHMIENNIENQLYTIINPLLKSINKEKPLLTILKYMDKSSKEPEKNFEYLQALFNCATSLNKHDLANTLDKDHSILEKSITKQMPKQIRLYNDFPSWLTLDNGFVTVRKTFGTHISTTDMKANYLINPILFNLGNGNHELLDTFFNKGYEVHPSLITHALISNIYLKNNKALSYLIKNAKYFNMIQESNEIQEFLNNDESCFEHKKNFKSLLLMNELKEELIDTNLTIKNKLKI